MKMKTMLAAAAMMVAGMVGFAGVSAQASTSAGPLWACHLGFAGKAQGLQVVVGKFDVTARGKLSCADITGQKTEIPVKVTMSSGPVAPRIAFGSYDVVGTTGEISLFNNEPNDMLGHYIVAQAQGAIFRGAGVITGVHVGIPDLTLQVSLQFLKGFGLNLGITTMTISADEAL